MRGSYMRAGLRVERMDWIDMQLLYVVQIDCI